MATSAIRLKDLHKLFGRRRRLVRAVRGIDLDVPAGQVYGFLGPNGAGKSTTIRIILDLVRPTQGEVELFGRPLREAPANLRRVGAMVEGARFYDYLSGRRNLAVLARTAGCYNPVRINALLEQVDMAERADRLVKGYSTGMKQRLGLAAALLTDPDLVILDEPTNGLDPSGIQAMRHFIRQLADEQGKTVFLSSHLLGEVEQVCDRVAIINEGQIVSEGNVAELLAGQSQLRLEVTPIDVAERWLAERWPVARDGRWLTVQAPRDATPDIVKQLVAQGITIYQVQVTNQSLEAHFMAVAGQERAA